MALRPGSIGTSAISEAPCEILLFGVGLRTTSSSAATIITLIEPVIATALAVAIVGEPLTPTAWLGLVLIFVVITAISTASHPRKPLVSP